MKKIEGWVTAPQGFLAAGSKPAVIMMWLLFTALSRLLRALFSLRTKCVLRLSW